MTTIDSTCFKIIPKRFVEVRSTCVRLTLAACVFLDLVKTKIVFQSAVGRAQFVSILCVAECHERRVLPQNISFARNTSVST